VDRLFAGLLDEARRSIARQEANLDALRTKTSAVLGAIAVVAGLFGPHALDRGRAGFSAWVAIAVTTIAFAAGCVVVYPRKFKFNVLSIGKWVTALDNARNTKIPQEVDDAVNSNDRDMAITLFKYLRDNKPKIEQMTTFYGIAVVGLLAEAVAWGVDRGLHG
jgi:hypothetical protein